MHSAHGLRRSAQPGLILLQLAHLSSKCLWIAWPATAALADRREKINAAERASGHDELLTHRGLLLALRLRGAPSSRSTEACEVGFRDIWLYQPVVFCGKW